MKQWLYLLFTLGFIFFLFRLVNIKEAVSLLSRTRGPLIVLATVLGIVQSFLLSLRLQVLLSILARISILYLWALGFLSALVSHLFPFWIGGLGLVSVVAKKIKVSLAKTLGLEIKEIPVVWINDARSKVSFKAYLQVLMETFKIRLWLWRDIYNIKLKEKVAN